MSVIKEIKIDGHCHVLDPARFPYNPAVSYHPTGQEMGDAAYFLELMRCYHVTHALLVGPNSGYGLDNRYLLHALKIGQGAFKGIAVVPNDCDLDALQELKAIKEVEMESKAKAEIAPSEFKPIPMIGLSAGYLF